MKKNKKRQRTAKEKRIIALAYFHRYILVFAIGLYAATMRHPWLSGYLFIFYALYTLLGYLLQWKHIFCSFQDMQHMTMTPLKIHWRLIPKRDVLGYACIFLTMGFALILLDGIIVQG